MGRFNISIAYDSNTETSFIQTNFIKANGDIIPLAYSQCNMTEDDTKELAETLSSVCTVDFEDTNHNCTIYSDGNIIDTYKNE